MNQLVSYLRHNNHVGAARAIRRAALAAALQVSGRDLRRLSEEARNAGEFVAYSTRGIEGGIFLASTDDEKVAIVGQIRSTCLKRLRQYGALKRALKDQHQTRLFPETVDDVFRSGR